MPKWIREKYIFLTCFEPLRFALTGETRRLLKPVPFTGETTLRWRAAGEFSLIGALQAHYRAHTSLSRFAGSWLTTPAVS